MKLKLYKHNIVLSTIVLILLMMCSCKSSIPKQVKDISKKEEPRAIENTRSDTVGWFSYKDEIRIYTRPEYVYIISQDVDNNFHLRDILRDQNFKEVITQDNKVLSASYYSFGKEIEKYEVEYNQNKQVGKVKRYTIDNKLLKLKSIENYSYTDSLLVSFEFKDVVRISTVVDTSLILMEHDYDEANRLRQTLISRGSNKRKYYVADTVSYFYKDKNSIPYLVRKTAFGGTEFKIKKKGNGDLEMTKLYKSEHKGHTTIEYTYYHSYDQEGRINEYQITTDINIQEELVEVRYEKYKYQYAEKNNLENIPKILFSKGDRKDFPNSNIFWYFTSNVEINQYPDVFLRTDLGSLELPKKIEKFKSYDGINWVPSYKLEKTNDIETTPTSH